MSVRAFVAIELPASIQAKLDEIQKQVRSVMGFKAIWVRPEAMHVTLKFMGSVEDDRVPAIMTKLADVAFTPFVFHVKRLGGFPSFDRPRVLWAGSEPNAALTGLHRGIDDRLATIGFDPETRDFNGHVTLARFKEVPRLPDPIKRMIKGIQLDEQYEVNAFALFESKLTAKGPVYTVLKRFPARRSGPFH